MKLVINLKLTPDAAQQRTLRATLERCNEACDWLSEQAFETQVFGQYALHKAFYRNVREQFGLTAQAAVRCIGKVADAYKLKNYRKVQRKFRRWAGQPYDDRILRFAKDDHINLWTLTGRQLVPFVCGSYQRQLLPFRKGEVDLLFIKGKWYASCVVDIDEAEPITPTGVLGIDMGIVNISTDTMGERHDGAAIEAQRVKFVQRRATLQRVGTRAAKKRLCKNNLRQSRFQKHENHCISKSIVSKAKRYSLVIYLEELKHIRARVKANKEQRKRLHNWAFGHLRDCIEYKAKRAGIPIVAIDPAYTSQTCYQCGVIDKRNRKSQSEFRCIACGHEAHADENAARNIAGKGRPVTLPMFAHQCVPGAVESLAL
jgi:putative transposase